MSKYLLVLFFTLYAATSYAGSTDEFKEVVVSYSKKVGLPIIITPKAKENYLEHNIAWKWEKLEKYVVGYAEVENIEKILLASNKNYKVYKSTEPDKLDATTLSFKFGSPEVSTLGKFFDHSCRTFMEGYENINGSATIYSELFYSQETNCEIIVLAFSMNNIHLKKTKRGRTLVLSQEK